VQKEPKMHGFTRPKRNEMRCPGFRKNDTRYKKLQKQDEKTTIKNTLGVQKKKRKPHEQRRCGGGAKQAGNNSLNWVAVTGWGGPRTRKRHEGGKAENKTNSRKVEGRRASRKGGKNEIAQKSNGYTVNQKVSWPRTTLGRLSRGSYFRGKKMCGEARRLGKNGKSGCKETKWDGEAPEKKKLNRRHQGKNANRH